MVRKAQTNDFAERLTSLMTKHDLTVRRAAQIAGVGASKVQSWRSGALPTDYAAVKKLANHLGSSLSYLLTGEEDSEGDRGPPQIDQVFKDGGMIFDGYCQVTIKKMIPRSRSVG